MGMPQLLANIGAMTGANSLMGLAGQGVTASILDQAKKDAMDKEAIERQKMETNKIVDMLRFLVQMFAH